MSMTRCHAVACINLPWFTMRWRKSSSMASGSILILMWSMHLRQSSVSSRKLLQGTAIKNSMPLAGKWLPKSVLQILQVPSLLIVAYHQRNALPAELSIEFAEVPCQFCAAIRACPIFTDGVIADDVPVADDQRLSAFGAERCAAAQVMHIAGIDMLQSGRLGDLACLCQIAGRCGRNIGHLVIGMKRGEVQRHIRSQFLRDPFAHLADLMLTV